MNAWSHRRKRIIFSIVLMLLIVVVGVPLFFFLYKAPSCTDNKQNGDELGVDCGGSCKLLCSAQTLPLLSKGDPRILKIGTSTYEVVLEVENPNVSASVYRGNYSFKVFDSSSVAPIKVIEGSTYIPHGSSFVIFEGPYNFGERVPTRATFEWKEEGFKWSKDTRAFPDLVIEGEVLLNANTLPQVTAVLQNTSLEDASNIELVALIADESGNTFAASKTFIEYLGSGESVPIAFSWPTAFTSSTALIRILPRLLPDQSFIR